MSSTHYGATKKPAHLDDRRSETVDDHHCDTSGPAAGQAALMKLARLLGRQAAKEALRAGHA